MTQEMSYQRHKFPRRCQVYFVSGCLADRHGHVQDLGRALGVFGDVVKVRLQAHQALGNRLGDVALALPEEQAMGHEVVRRHLRHLFQDLAFIAVLQDPSRFLAFLVVHRQLVCLTVSTAQSPTLWQNLATLHPVQALVGCFGLDAPPSMGWESSKQ